jgi:predicted phosphodiesterase
VCDRNYEEFTLEKFKNDLKRLYPKSNLINEQRQDQKNVLSSFFEYKKDKSDLKILVLNDIHIQYNYKEGGKVNCGDTGGCCSDKSDPNLEEDDKAGYWGTRMSNCDTPKRTFEETLKFIKENVEFDMLIVLGDLISQDSWNYSREDLIENNKYIFDQLTKTFWNGKKHYEELGKDDILILPVNGNHETEFLDYENYDEESDFVKQGILTEYEKFIGIENVKQMQKKGYYEIIDSARNIRYIGVDSNFNSIYNYYSSIDSTNPMNFIYNLGNTLYECEQQNQKVIFLSHIPFSDETGMTTLGKFIKLLFQRFENIIDISIAAHTHNDTISFYHDVEGNPMFLELTSPSLTTYTDLFPSFRVYEMNSDGRIVDYVQWRMNIDILNIFASQGNYKFEFEQKYRFSEEYGIDLEKTEKKEELIQFKQKLFSNSEYLKKYVKNFLTLYKLPEDRQAVLNKMEEVKCLMLDEVDYIENCLYQNGGNYMTYIGTVLYRKFFERKIWFSLNPN